MPGRSLLQHLALTFSLRQSVCSHGTGQQHSLESTPASMQIILCWHCMHLPLIDDGSDVGQYVVVSASMETFLCKLLSGTLGSSLCLPLICCFQTHDPLLAWAHTALGWQLTTDASIYGPTQIDGTVQAARTWLEGGCHSMRLDLQGLLST